MIHRLLALLAALLVSAMTGCAQVQRAEDIAAWSLREACEAWLANATDADRRALRWRMWDATRGDKDRGHAIVLACGVTEEEAVSMLGERPS